MTDFFYTFPYIILSAAEPPKVASYATYLLDLIDEGHNSIINRKWRFGAYESTRYP